MDDTRNLKIMFQKGGSGSISSRVALPKSWMDKLGLNSENRDVVASLDINSKQITISLPKKDS